MKEYAMQIVRQAASRGRPAAYQEALMREYIQLQVLKELEQAGAFSQVAFMGGTALRFIYGSQRFSDGVDLSAAKGSYRRFSEDVDLTLEKGGHEFASWMQGVQTRLQRAGFDARSKWNTSSTVIKGEVIVPGVLKELGLAAMKDQKLVVKVELDSNPPAGAGFQSHTIRRPQEIAVRCHDLPSLMAGKISALVTRPFVKARDWYDFVFFCDHIEKGINPNLELLRNRLAQHERLTGQKAWPAEEWFGHVKARVQDKAFPASLADGLRGFLEDPEAASFYSQENLLRTIEQVQQVQQRETRMEAQQSIGRMNPPAL